MYIRKLEVENILANFRIDDKGNILRKIKKSNQFGREGEWVELGQRLTKKGYRALIRIGESKYPYHRVAWVLYYGTDPFPYQIDHIDGNRSNNLKNNIRLVTNRENQHNSTAHRNGKPCGVWYNRKQDKYKAKLTIRRKACSLGSYKKEKDAINIVRRALKIKNLEQLEPNELRKALGIKNTPRIKGAAFEKETCKWVSSIYIKGKHITIKRFTTSDEAVACTEKAISNRHLYKGDNKKFRETILELLALNNLAKSC